MKKLALAFALGAATLFTGTAVNAADTAAKPDHAIGATATADASQATEVSSRHRRHWRHRHWHRYHYGYRPYYRSYGYYPGYYAPAPVISFGFGPRFHHRRHWW